ncbi:glycosyltransferase [Butyrivibrio sp. NC3005]|uniref:glycosyltransferase n=1 Tax=Butyrivibrio sp. NC3005 TaxID=1280685 RepID=UPI000415E7B7|nr:glycosyltransferase [Butyrivibrio sp. NC3005]
MKKIMHVTEVLSGGVLPVIAGICNGLSDKYQFVVVFGLRFDTPKNLNEVFDSRVKLIPLPSLKLKISIKGDITAIKDLRRIVCEENPEVIHIHSTKAGIDARLGLWRCSAEKYYTPHGFCFLRKDQNRIKRVLLITMESFLTHFCDGIIACGKNEYKVAKKFTKKAVLINNGLDTKLVNEAEANVIEQEHRYTIYTAGRIGPQKNPRLFNEIATKLPEYRFVWIGDGDDRNQLTSPNIEITGLLPRKEVIRRAKNYDCYLSTSLWEGLPIALMEAMYMEKKCVVSNVEGNNELIVKGKTGTLFNKLEEACKQIIDNEDYGKEACKYIKANYSLEGMCRKYEEVYK